MTLVSRAAGWAAVLCCALGLATASGPSFASDLAQPSATAMLAAVTAPLLAVDVRTLQAQKPDYTIDPAAAPADIATATAGATLADLVEQNMAGDADDDEGKCLAATVYFESKGEPLDGQLAVAQTILNRAASGRFADTLCGVVRQPGQFSFLHGGQLPEPPHASSAWARAVAVAKIARAGLWKQIAPAALFFHARRVAPGWGKVRVASLGNHIFFR